MDIYDTYEGNAETETVEDKNRETVTVGGDQRRRSRFRTTTDSGREVGVVVGRELRAGDVLSTGAGDGPRLEVVLEPVEAVVVCLADAAADLTAAVTLGHAAGNRHWEMAVRAEEVLVPAVESDTQMETTLRPHLPEGATLRRERVSPALFDGQVESAGHSHGDGHSHSHGADAAHSHEQCHGDEADSTARYGGESR
ncbi:MAG: urease accessory protein [Natronomonas sp.]|jgi:urease accessory protein